ncbi:MAG: flagellar hook capping FlgD N-terminal domain-containing protein [Pseudomonadota bacterium]
MAITPVPNGPASPGGIPVVITPPANGGPNNPNSADKAKDLQQDFLKLLLTQLANQSPLDPVDPTEYTNQLVQYSALEQQLDTNLKLEKLIAANTLSNNVNAFTYIGYRVEMDTTMTAMQSDMADWTYTLQNPADKVEVTVRDAAGKVVRRETVGKQEAGSYKFTLNKADANPAVANGDVLAITVEALDAEGKRVSYSVTTEVVVEGVETSSAGIVMRSGKLNYDLDDIYRVLGPAPSAPNPAPVTV